jgi:hypothetical protein
VKNGLINLKINKMTKKKTKTKTKDNTFYAIVPEGKLEVINQCGVNYKGRNILFQQLEDKSVGICITRPDKGEEHPAQSLRLTELTLNLLLLTIFQAGREFNIDFEKITEEINQTLEKQQQNENK